MSIVIHAFVVHTAFLYFDESTQSCYIHSVGHLQTVLISALITVTVILGVGVGLFIVMNDAIVTATATRVHPVYLYNRETKCLPAVRPS